VLLDRQRRRSATNDSTFSVLQQHSFHHQCNEEEEEDQESSSALSLAHNQHCHHQEQPSYTSKLVGPDPVLPPLLIQHEESQQD